MRTVIREALTRKYANKVQELKIVRLRKKHPNLFVLPHRKGGKYQFHVLVNLGNKGAFWMSPKGRITSAEAPNQTCFGNPTVAHCINYGYCTRSLACNE